MRDAAHDTDFRSSEKDFDAFAGVLTDKIIELDDTIPELPVKDVVSVVRVQLAFVFFLI